MRHRDFALAWLARILSTTSYQMLTVAVGWQIYDITRDPLDLAWVGLVQFVPAVLLVFVVGHVADRYDRRAVFQACLVVEVVAAALLAATSAAQSAAPLAILAIVLMFGAARAFEQPTTNALIPRLVPAEELPKALAWTAASTQASIIGGPAIGGFLYLAGPTAVYSTCAGLFVAAALALARLHAPRARESREPVTLRSVFGGITFIRNRRPLLGAISLDMFAVLLGGATALLPIYARDILETGPGGLGLLRAAPAVGALAMSLWLTRKPPQDNPGRTMFAAVAVFGVATVVFGLSTSFALSLASLAVLGAADMVSVVIRQSLVQLQTPDEMRGRVNAINSLFIGTSNKLGEFESGVVAAWLGAVASVVVGGVGTLIVVVAWIRLFPELTKMQHLRGQ